MEPVSWLAYNVAAMLPAVNNITFIKSINLKVCIVTNVLCTWCTHMAGAQVLHMHHAAFHASVITHTYLSGICMWFVLLQSNAPHKAQAPTLLSFWVQNSTSVPHNLLLPQSPIWQTKSGIRTTPYGTISYNVHLRSRNTGCQNKISTTWPCLEVLNESMACLFYDHTSRPLTLLCNHRTLWSYALSALQLLAGNSAVQCTSINK